MKKKIIFLLIFILCLAIRLAAVFVKDGLFLDDVYTYICATPCNLSSDGTVAKNSYKDFNFVFGKDYTVYEIKKTLFESNSSPKSIIRDLKQIRNHNIDRPHTNLHYSIYRIVSVGASGLNANELFIRGFIFNLLVFILEFFFMYKLLDLINRKTEFKAYGLLITLLSIASISNTLLIRCYALMECFFVGVSYVFVSLLLENGKLNYKKILGYSLITSVFLLSGYISLIYVGLWTGVFLIYALCKKNFRVFQNLFYILIISLCFVLLIYPSYFDFISQNEQYEVVMKNFDNFLNFSVSDLPFSEFFIFLSKYLFYKIFICCIALFYVFEFAYEKINLILKRTDNDVKNCSEDKEDVVKWPILMLLVILSMIWAFLSLTIAPYNHERFILPAVSVLALISVFLVSNLKTRVLKYFLIGLYIIIPCYNLYLDKKTAVSDFLFLHSYIGKEDFCSNEKYVFHMGESAFFYPNFYILMPDDSIIRFEKDIPSRTDYDLKTYKLVTDIELLDNLEDAVQESWMYVYSIKE